MDMDMDVAPLGAPKPLTAVGPPAATGAPFDMTRDLSQAIGAASASIDATVPVSPPSEVLREVDAAAGRPDWLREHSRELHFILPPDGGRVRVEVRDVAGRLIREIPPSEALDAISGGPFE